jgi:uncharacterized phage-associated protein
MSFSHKKAVQIINFFTRKSGGEISKLHMLKLVFFADRYHLRKYGRPITDDQYWAMRLGPVASSIKEIAELNSGDAREMQYARRFLAAAGRQHHVRSVADMEPQVFSESDREALEFAWDRFGGSKDLVEQTHLYPEWQKHAGALETQSRARIAYEDFLEDPPAGVEPCHPLTPEMRELRREQLQERRVLERVWE